MILFRDICVFEEVAELICDAAPCRQTFPMSHDYSSRLIGGLVNNLLISNHWWLVTVFGYRLGYLGFRCRPDLFCQVSLPSFFVRSFQDGGVVNSMLFTDCPY